MAIYKSITAKDVKATRTVINQIVDVVQEDISGSATRRKYQVFVTGGIGPGVTSSLFHTVYDQDFTLQTANPMFDMTVGLFSGSTTVQSVTTGEDSAGKLLFPSTSLMMREKVAIYEQFAQLLLGDSTSRFKAAHNTGDNIDEALFICIKRLFTRDRIKKETFALKFYQSASMVNDGGANRHAYTPNLSSAVVSGSKIYTDVGSATNQEVAVGGQVSNLVDSSDTNRNVGLLFNDHGIAVFDLAKILSASQKVSGVIDAMTNNTHKDAAKGQTIIGSPARLGTAGNAGASGNPRAKFIPDFVSSASIDDILNHVASTRFSNSTSTAMTFQNNTNVNSTLFFCRSGPNEFNYSSNPSYTDSDDRIRVIQTGQEAVEKSFTFVTSVGLYDASNNLLAVAKLSRPVEKNDEKDITFRVRLDF